MTRRINFLFLIAIIFGGFWLFSHTPGVNVIKVPVSTTEQMQPADNNLVARMNQDEEKEEINPQEEANKLYIQTPLYDDCDVAKIFYGEGLKVEYCTNGDFHYWQKTEYGFDQDTSSVMYDVDMKELGAWSKHVNASGEVIYSGLSLGGDCRVIESIKEACSKK